jgi:Major Facilitator Superfamily
VSGAAGLPCLSIIISVFPDPAERQQAIGLWAASSGIGFAVGPAISGLLLAHFWRGSVFLANVPIAAAGMAAATILVPESRNPAVLATDITGWLRSVCGPGLVLWSIIGARARRVPRSPAGCGGRTAWSARGSARRTWTARTGVGALEPADLRDDPRPPVAERKVGELTLIDGVNPRRAPAASGARAVGCPGLDWERNQVPAQLDIVHSRGSERGKAHQ